MTLSPPTLEKVRPVSIRAQVATLLREAILSRRFKPGDRLLERKLAEEMGVSQAALREALPELEHDGLITRKANTATYVTELTPKRVTEMVQVRLHLEPIAMVLASNNMTSENFEDLRSLVDEIEQAVGLHDQYRILKTDNLFHQKIWQISGNETLAKILNQLCAPLFAFFTVVNPDHEETKDHLELHQRLLQCLKNGNPKEIERIGREHVLSGWYPPEYRIEMTREFKTTR